MYDFKSVENQIQDKWDFITDIDKNKPKYYVLEMFPYPSGNIHMGHLRNYAIGDVIARYKRASGYNVLHPIGWDAFGLPAENAALQNQNHPAKWTKDNIDNMTNQLKSIGLSYDWSREIATCDSDYYRHEQQFFLKFLEQGIAYRKESYVNWDPVDNTVLANEQVIDGKGWRSGAKIERKKLYQWFLKITEFAPELLTGLNNLHDWPKKVRMMQSNWIGKSEGTIVNFEIIGKNESLKVFTTRPETIFRASFCAISVDHPLAKSLTEQKIIRFIQENSLTTTEEIEKAEKKGIDTGIKVRHPFLPDKKLPVYIANFVLAEYGTGAIFGCPAHDKRDHDFAKKYDLLIYPIIKTENNESYEIKEGTLYNSEFLNGLETKSAKKLVVKKLIEQEKGEKVTNYRLRDWGISRQRYWGCPIPIIYCRNCGTVPVPEKDLPVTLPDDVDFTLHGNPLANHPTWKKVKCPKCQDDATRETDTFDTFFESSWYFIAFCGLDKKSTDYFLPVDCYIGGIEHAVLHLLYARFFTKALWQFGYIDCKEPFVKLITQGMICHKTYRDEEGQFISPDEAKDLTRKGKNITIGHMEKMSKSKKNVINPGTIIDKYGADTARLFMLSDIPPERDLEWSEKGLEGAWRFINRIYKLVDPYDPKKSCRPLLSSRKTLHKCLHNLTEDLEHSRLNCTIAKLHEITNLLYNDKEILAEGIPILLRCIEPFIPHLAEYLWGKIGNSTLLCNEPWPKVEKKLLIDDTITIAVQVNGKLRKTIQLPIDSPKEEVEKSALIAIKNKIDPSKVKKKIVIPNKIVNLVI
ncbi:MAG: leucine--tRNA ligase [Rickettsiaceae bacterium H1]|nr:leucine--tRNA ligase [Rickettsiaceae bacterium H1]